MRTYGVGFVKEPVTAQDCLPKEMVKMRFTINQFQLPVVRRSPVAPSRPQCIVPITAESRVSVLGGGKAPALDWVVQR